MNRQIYWFGPRVHHSYYWGSFPRGAGPSAIAQAKKGVRPVTVVVDFGRKPGDMIAPLVWSTRIVTELRALEASGFETFPVRVKLKRVELPDYVGVRVTGKGGDLDLERSGAKVGTSGRIVYCEHGVYLKPGLVSDSDVFFIPRLGTNVFITSRLARRLSRLALKNCSVDPASEFL